jgi:hypothetical protein
MRSPRGVLEGSASSAARCGLRRGVLGMWIAGSPHSPAAATRRVRSPTSLRIAGGDYPDSHAERCERQRVVGQRPEPSGVATRYPQVRQLANEPSKLDRACRWHKRSDDNEKHANGNVFWQAKYHRSADSRWLRGVVFELFGDVAPTRRKERG